MAGPGVRPIALTVRIMLLVTLQMKLMPLRLIRVFYAGNRGVYGCMGQGRGRSVDLPRGARYLRSSAALRAAL